MAWFQRQLRSGLNRVITKETETTSQNSNTRLMDIWQNINRRLHHLATSSSVAYLLKYAHIDTGKNARYIIVSLVKKNEVLISTLFEASVQRDIHKDIAFTFLTAWLP